MGLRHTLATSRRTALVLLLALGGLLLLAACAPASGGGGAPVSQPTPTAQATQPPAQAPVTPAPPAAAKTAAPSAPAQTPAPPAGATLNACSLLTKQEVEGAIGKAVLLPQSKQGGEFCSFNDPETPASELVSIVVSVEPADAAKASFERDKKNPITNPQAVTGLGDDAYWEESLGSISVLKGPYTILIDVQAGAEQDRQNIAKGLASKAIGRLP